METCGPQNLKSTERIPFNVIIIRQAEKQMKKHQLISRLRQLYILEFLNAFALPFAFLSFGYVKNQGLGTNSLVAMILNGFLLFEGSYLWFGISRRLQTKEAHAFIGTFKFLKVLNFVLFVFASLIVALNPFLSTIDKVGTAFFFLLAVLEHVNYFEIQLMYDNKNDWKYVRRYKRLKVAKLKSLMNSRRSV